MSQVASQHLAIKHIGQDYVIHIFCLTSDLSHMIKLWETFSYD